MPTTLSTLVVTNRPQFTQWWTWSISKQSRPPDQVVVATNYPFESDEDKEAYLHTVKHLLPCSAMVEFLDEDVSIGELRQAALNQSTGDLINYVDDDDWYHPWLFAEFERKFEGGARLITARGNYRLILDELVLFRFDEIIDLIHLPFSAIDGSLARRIRFVPISIDEDIQWLHQVSSFVRSNRAGAFLTPNGNSEVEIPIMCMIHSRNTWNRKEISGYEIAIKMTSQALPREAPWSIPPEEWRRTWSELELLRERLY